MTFQLHFLLSYLERERGGEEQQHHFRYYMNEIQFRKDNTKICKPCGFWGSHDSISVWKEVTDGLQYINVIH